MKLTWEYTCSFFLFISHHSFNSLISALTANLVGTMIIIHLMHPKFRLNKFLALSLIMLHSMC